MRFAARSDTAAPPPPPAWGRGAGSANDVTRAATTRKRLVSFFCAQQLGRDNRLAALEPLLNYHIRLRNSARRQTSRQFRRLVGAERRSQRSHFLATLREKRISCCGRAAHAKRRAVGLPVRAGRLIDTIARRANIATPRGHLTEAARRGSATCCRPVTLGAARWESWPSRRLDSVGAARNFTHLETREKIYLFLVSSLGATRERRAFRFRLGRSGRVDIYITLRVWPAPQPQIDQTGAPAAVKQAAAENSHDERPAPAA